MSGPLTGYVCLLDVGDFDVSPVHSSLENFVRALGRALSAGADWSRLDAEYPRRSASESDPADLSVVLALFSESAACADARRAAQLRMCALQILPLGHEQVVREHLRDADLWVRARACEIVAAQRIVAFVPELLEIARTGVGPNDRIAALVALQELPGKAAANAVATLAKELGPEWRAYFRSGYSPSAG
ncbi:MAG: hypothetical protein K8T90_05845 [Planctomycetes bacterium]|nr:hypothetical protein [Planctomycetota bacterium]